VLLVMLILGYPLVSAAMSSGILVLGQPQHSVGTFASVRQTHVVSFFVGVSH